MNNEGISARRITCSIHQQISDQLVSRIRTMGISVPIFMESCRSVRQIQRPRPMGIPGSRLILDDSPGNRIFITAPSDCAESIMHLLVDAAALHLPGHGSIFEQDISLFDEFPDPSACLPNHRQSDAAFLKDLSLITCIVSNPGAGEQIAETALELGTCVPTITLGIGTGIRDKLGLLRITIPPEKELVHLLVPSHDSEGIVQLLIEHSRMNRPGGGFLYCTPVRSGIIDTRLRIGKQEHPASIEQIIAAIDEMKQGTSWRKRFVESTRSGARMMRRNTEITIICREGYADRIVEAAMQAGAAGATVSRLKRIGAGTEESAARERCIITVPAGTADNTIQAVLQAKREHQDYVDTVELLKAPLAYAYQS